MINSNFFRCFDYTGVVNRLGVNITGIARAAEITALNAAAVATNQMDVEENLIVPEVKPDIEQIYQANLRVCLEDAWLSPGRNKIFIKGVLWQKLLYTACRADQPAHTVERAIPFSHFIDITGTTLPAYVIQNLPSFITLAPEDAFVQLKNGRNVFKDVLIAAFLIIPGGA